ncbi:HAD family hydrolase [Kitasatospora kazusensis]|uniref:HAD family hydrolase n=1 Tax=Kitasatospora kazusensis TaxID=407974 RepID=A0ABP5LB61_9ACTN
MHKNQVLIFDADDTLWENNILFERVIDGFLDWVSMPARRAATRAALDAIEAENAVTLGYGVEMFRQSLGDCLEGLTGHAPAAAEIARIEALLSPLTDRQIDLIDGVADTLAVLAERHELLLLTKGNPAEQQRKVDASGIAHRFRSIHIVAEKTADTYRQLGAELGLEGDRTWMVGNSPKSDMHPAREAGLKTVFIPHEHTWVLEFDEQRPEGPTLELRCFSQLLEHF